MEKAQKISFRRRAASLLVAVMRSACRPPTKRCCIGWSRYGSLGDLTSVRGRNGLRGHSSWGKRICFYARISGRYDAARSIHCSPAKAVTHGATQTNARRTAAAYRALPCHGSIRPRILGEVTARRRHSRNSRGWYFFGKRGRTSLRKATRHGSTRPFTNPSLSYRGAGDRPTPQHALQNAWFGNIARALRPGRAFYLWGGYSNCANY